MKEGNIHGIKVRRNAPELSHIYFADDCLLFTRANSMEADCLLTTLDRSNKEVFSFVIERVWKKVKGCNESFLWRAGREVLIKAVAQAIPTYIMSCSKLSESYYNEIESILEKFSLLGKHYWRLLVDEQSFVGRVFKSHYYPRSSILDAKSGYLPSYTWRSILNAGEVVKKGYRCRIGNGEKVSIWKDKWISGSNSLYIKSPVCIIDTDAKVSALVDHDLFCWKRDFVMNFFDHDEIVNVIRIPLFVR
ncbi:uncharacterized protein LOC131597557 [Vicia villosa]|uniref:uncharacterized protein LOC131597557 n=1 Tax=Vicia villosa TaxID=3911 RepID=UPI00273B6BDB|nr:uncharacterized protein LOC131597557 [Vicia villosa]